jgi:hypothetical protein
MGNLIGSLLQRRFASFAALAVAAGMLAASGWSGEAFGANGASIALSNASARSAACKAIGVTHVYVTIRDVKAHRSGKGTAGFVSLTSGEPEQFDLLFGQAEGSEDFQENDCPIVSMGGSGLLPGKYQQIRLLIVPNGATSNSGPVISPGENACSSLGDTVYNCVMANGELSPLQIPSGAQTGIKIPSSQIARGGIVIKPGQGLDLDIDIDACQSLVVHGGGKQKAHGHGHGKGGKGPKPATYALKPVLHAGEVSLQPIIAGVVVVGTSGGPGKTVNPGTAPVPNANVWLEQLPSTPTTVGNPGPSQQNLLVTDITARTTTDSNGQFAFCPVPAGNYAIVADAPQVGGNTNPSDATITTGVTVENNGGPNGLVIPLISGSSSAAQLSSEFTTQAGPVTPGTGDDISFEIAQTVSDGVVAPVPPYSGTSTSPVTTSSNGCTLVCPVGTNCACANLVVPPDNPVISQTDGSYLAGTGSASWSIAASATQIGTTTPDCSPSSMVTNPTGAPLPQPTLSFQGCQQ